MERYYTDPSLVKGPLAGQATIKGSRETRNAQSLLARSRKESFNKSQAGKIQASSLGSGQANPRQTTSEQNKQQPAEKLDSGKQEINAGRNIAQAKKAKITAQGQASQAEHQSRILDGGKLKIATASVLYWSWWSGLTVVALIWLWLYANLHALGLMIFGPKVFCRFGEEWVLGGPAKIQIIPELKSPVTGPALERLLESKIKKVGLIEKVLLILLDAIVLAVFLIHIFNITLIVALANPELWGELLIDVVWDVLKSLFSTT